MFNSFGDNYKIGKILFFGCKINRSDPIKKSFEVFVLSIGTAKTLKGKVLTLTPLGFTEPHIFYRNEFKISPVYFYSKISTYC